MAVQDCLDAIREAFKGKRKLTDEQIEQMAEEISERAGPGAGPEEFQNAARQYANEVLEAAFVERRNRRINFDIKRRIMNLAAEADRKFGNPGLALKAVIAGISRGLDENAGRNSIEAMQGALFGESMGGLIADLERAGLLPHLNSGQIDLDVMRALESLTDPDAPGSQSRSATQIAELIHKHRTVAFDERNRAGAWVKRLKGFIMRQQHDMDKLRRVGFDEWKDFILPKLHPRTFEGVEDVDGFLQGAYTALTSGVQYQTGDAPSALRLAFKGPGNLAKRKSEFEHRSLHFTNADEAFAYNERFGIGSLRENIVHEFMSYARDTGIMRGLGTNPKAMLDEVRGDLRRLHEGNPKKLSSIDSTLVDAEFDIATGLANVPVSATLAEVSNWIKFTQNASKLGAALISSVVDPVNIAASLRNTTGANIFTALKEGLTAPLSVMASKEKRIYGELLGIVGDGQIGHFSSRWSADDSLIGSASKANRIFFKLNLLTQWTDAHKKGIGLALSRILAMQKTRAWGQIDDQLRFNLQQFGIDESGWDAARGTVQRAADGKEYLFPDQIADRDLALAFRGFIVDAAEAGVPTPGIRERAILTRGLRAGTPEGEAIRHAAIFKGFPTTVLTKVLGRAVYNNADGKADKVGIAAYMASSMALGYMAMVGKDLAKGRTPRDFNDDPVGTVIAALIQGGGLGIYGDFIFAETNRFGRSLTETLAGPTFGAIGDIHELWARFRSGDDVAASALRTIMQNTPGANLFYTKVPLDYLIFYHLQEMANPGYLRRAERRLERDFGQTYILPPSQVVQ